MLDTLTPAEFDELMAADIVDPDPLERIPEILKLVGAAMCLGDVKPDQFEPPRKVIRVEGETESEMRELGGNGDEGPALSPNQAAAWAAMCLGRPPDKQKR